MMKNIKAYVIGIVIGASLMFSVQSFAAVGDKVEAIFASFNLVVNGQTKTMQTSPLIYNGTSYLPVRDISNLLGYDVTYKADSRTIELNNGTVTGGVYGGGGQETTVPSPSSVNVNPIVDQSTDKDSKSNITEVKGYYNFNSHMPAYNYNGNIYLSLLDGSAKYNIDTRNIVMDAANKSIQINGHAITISESLSPNVDAFNFNGSTLVKEDFFKN